MDIMNDNKIPYQVYVTDDDNYNNTDYFFKFTSEELEIITWFLNETQLIKYCNFHKIKKDIFAERIKK